ncbi:MAG: hypothetical protein PVJ86_08690 [Phycisphaerales bacterium]|jgi:hypothetical protein
MIGTDSNHCKIVAESLAGERAVDEQTFASLAILDERLERLKKLDEAFSGVEFSSDVEELRSRKNAVAVS